MPKYGNSRSKKFADSTHVPGLSKGDDPTGAENAPTSADQILGRQCLRDIEGGISQGFPRGWNVSAKILVNANRMVAE